MGIADTIAERLQAALREANNLERTEAVLSEGFCPSCTRPATPPFADFDDEGDNRHPLAVVFCARCKIRWRYGPDGGDEKRPWIEASGTDEQVCLTMTVNPPAELDDDIDDDHWYDDELVRIEDPENIKPLKFTDEDGEIRFDTNDN